jgi:pSer/pThr/pTyr-binding forkhead associated (FHA) protein/polyhydroxyalkanoate synthesis regulator phasin
MDKLSPQRFFSECGGTEPIKLLLEHEENATSAIFVFHQPSILIGHHASADLRLPSTCVSSRQLYLQMLDGRLLGLALSRSHPTRWRSSTSSWTWIDENDVIGFGPYNIRIVEGARSSSADSLPNDNPLVSISNVVPPLLLESDTKPGQPFRGVINRPLTLIGSSDWCKFRIQSDHVSGIHCSLVRTLEGFWVADLCGRGGVRLNEAPCKFGKLEEHDRFEIGGIEFRIQRRSTFSSSGFADSSRSPVTDHGNGTGSASSKSLGELRQKEQRPFSEEISPILDRFAAIEKQIDQQSQELLDSLNQKFELMLIKQQDHFAEEKRRVDELTRELAKMQEILGPFPEAVSQEEPPFAVPEPKAEEPPPALPKPQHQAPQPKFDPMAPVADGEMHIWLQSRIAEIQIQRRTLMSRLKTLLGGKCDPI